MLRNNPGNARACLDLQAPMPATTEILKEQRPLRERVLLCFRSDTRYALKAKCTEDFYKPLCGEPGKWEPDYRIHYGATESHIDTQRYIDEY